MHFQTKTTIDTLDYSGERLNEGSKVIIAAAGKTKRKLTKKLPKFELPSGFSDPFLVSDGNLVIQSNDGIIEDLIKNLEKFDLNGIALITVVDDSKFTSEDFKKLVMDYIYSIKPLQLIFMV